MSSEFYDFIEEIKTDEVLGILMIFILVVLGIALIVGIFKIIYTWKLFKKAGKGGWEALIPYYNKWVLTEISEVNWWWFLILVFAPMLSISYSIGSNFNEDATMMVALAPISMMLSIGEIMANLVISINLAKKFNKGAAFGVLIALLPIIGIPIIAFGKDKYDFDVKVPANGIFGGEPLNKNSSSNKKENNETNKNKCSNCGNKVIKDMDYCPNCGNKLK